MGCNIHQGNTNKMNWRTMTHISRLVVQPEICAATITESKFFITQA